MSSFFSVFSPDKEFGSPKDPADRTDFLAEVKSVLGQAVNNRIRSAVNITDTFGIISIPLSF